MPFAVANESQPHLINDNAGYLHLEEMDKNKIF